MAMAGWATGKTCDHAVMGKAQETGRYIYVYARESETTGPCRPIPELWNQNIPQWYMTYMWIVVVPQSWCMCSLWDSTTIIIAGVVLCVKYVVVNSGARHPYLEVKIMWYVNICK
jgi:hypothetical protein